MQYENNRADPKRAEELAREILDGPPSPDSPLRRILDAERAKEAGLRTAAFGALLRGRERRIASGDEQAAEQAGTDQRIPKRTSKRTAF